MSDNRGWLNHRVQQLGHELNTSKKENGMSGIQTSGAYNSMQPTKGKKPGQQWSTNVDKKEAEYHKQKAKDAKWTNIW